MSIYVIMIKIRSESITDRCNFWNKEENVDYAQSLWSMRVIQIQPKPMEHPGPAQMGLGSYQVVRSRQEVIFGTERTYRRVKFTATIGESIMDKQMSTSYPVTV